MSPQYSRGSRAFTTDPYLPALPPSSASAPGSVAGLRTSVYDSDAGSVYTDGMSVANGPAMDDDDGDTIAQWVRVASACSWAVQGLSVCVWGSVH